MKQISIGLIGAGTVGSGLIEILHSHQKQILEKPESILFFHRYVILILLEFLLITKGKLSQTLKITENPKNDIVVELVGGTELPTK